MKKSLKKVLCLTFLIGSLYLHACGSVNVDNLCPEDFNGIQGDGTTDDGGADDTCPSSPPAS